MSAAFAAVAQESDFSHIIDIILLVYKLYYNLTGVMFVVYSL